MRETATGMVIGIVLFCSACTHVPTGGSGGASGGATSPAVQSTFSKPVSFAILQDYKKGEDLNQVALDFALMKELGVRIWRGSFAWDDYEPVMRKYDLEWLHRFVELADRYGLKLRPYLAYTPQWAAKGGADKEAWNDPPARPSDWRGYVETITAAMARHRNILSFEVYNEENVRQWWDGTAAEYNEVLRQASQAVKKVSPERQVIFGGMVYPDAEWVKQACLTYGNAASFNVLPFHAYPETWTPPTLTVENYLDQGYPGHFRGTFVKWADQYCGKKPIWINEAGYATSPGKTEADQANWWARAFATFLADPRIEHIGIYQIKERKKEEKVIGESENYYLGITRPDRSKKLAFFTLKRLIALLDTGTLTIADGELGLEVTAGRQVDLYRHLFVRPDGRQIIFVWDKRGSPTVRLRPRPGASAVEYALDGSSKPYTAYDGQALERVRLTPGMVRVFEIRP